MFFLLIKMRLQSGLNVTRDTLRRHPLLATGLSLLSILLFGCGYAAVFTVFRFAEERQVLPETVYQVFYFLFLFLLAGAVPFVASTLLHSADYPLLFSAPLPPRAIIAAKLLDATVTNSLQFTVLGIPAIVAAAGAVGLPLGGWALLPLLIALFVLLPALITALALLLALAALGMRRLRAAISLLNAVMAIGVCFTIVLEAGHLPVRSGSFTGSLTELDPSLAAGSLAARYSPSSWFAGLLLAMSRGGVEGATGTLLNLGLIGLIVGALFAACLLLGERLLSAASVAEEQDNGSVIGGRAAQEAGWLWKKLFTAPIAALIVKDFKYLWRDSVLLSQLAMPMILFFVPFLMGMQEPSLRGRSEMFPFASVMTGVIVFMQTSILSLSSIGLEGRGFWIVQTAPMTGTTFVWAKFVLSAFVSASIGMFLTLAAGLAFGISGTLLLLHIAGVILCSAALCGLGVGISAAFPRFVYENPAHRVSAWALILGFFTTIAYLIVSGALLGIAVLLAMQSRSAQSTQLIYSTFAAIYLALTGFAAFAPLLLGAKRIEVYQWEH